MKVQDTSKWLLALTAVGVFLFGLVIGWQLNKNRAQGSDPAFAVRENSQNKYKFIDPLIVFDTNTPTQTVDFKDLQQKLQGYVDIQLRRRTIDSISIYFREPKTARWTGINMGEKYNPASLLKVPTMIAFFKAAESDPEVLSKKVFYDGSFDDNKAEYFKVGQGILPGHWYTIEELIRSMVAYSDNNATALLHKNIDEDLLKEVYEDFGLAIPTTNTVDFMTVKSYAYFFRALYNATYLSREFSEKALEFLAGPDFPRGITAGVPKTVTVAQKFGERTVTDVQTNLVEHRELHDCGFVYYPNNPYLICIMTKGQSFDQLTSVIQGLSKLIYGWVDNRKGQ